MTTLQQYEIQVADVLHDPNNNKWSLSQLDRYINEARRQLAMDTGCLRSLQASYITTALEQYTFGQVTGGVVTAGGSNYTAPTVAFSGGGGSGVAATLGLKAGAVNTLTFTNYGSGYSTVPSYVISDGTGSGAQLALGIINVMTYDVLGVSVLWGTQRYVLRWFAFRDFTARMRPWTASTYQQQPAAWAVYGDTALFIGPPPDQSYAVEFDSIILPTDLADYVTADPIPPMVQDPIKYYAAYIAKNNEQSFGEAEVFKQQYRIRLLEAQAAYVGRVPDVYANRS